MGQQTMTTDASAAAEDADLLPSRFATVTGRPDRVIALHFHLPVWVSNLADVMPHDGTRREVTDRVLEFARQIGQVPIELRRELGVKTGKGFYSYPAPTFARAGFAEGRPR